MWAFSLFLNLSNRYTRADIYTYIYLLSILQIHSNQASIFYFPTEPKRKNKGNNDHYNQLYSKQPMSFSQLCDNTNNNNNALNTHLSCFFPNRNHQQQQHAFHHHQGSLAVALPTTATIIQSQLDLSPNSMGPWFQVLFAFVPFYPHSIGELHYYIRTYRCCCHSINLTRVCIYICMCI